MASVAAGDAKILLDWADAQLVEWDFRHALALTQEAGRAAEPLLCDRPPIVVYGRHCRQPRDVAFFSDESMGYFYSRQVMRSQPLPPPLRALLVLVNSTLGATFNGILVNRYRTGKDNVGAHSDSEHGLDVSAGVVALSLGATRKFRLRSKPNHEIVGDYNAREGYALQMRGARFQSLLVHEVPAQSLVTESRLSLTFRKHMPEHEQGLVDIFRKQELRELPASRSRSPRRIVASSFLIIRLTGKYGLRDSSLIDRCVALVYKRACDTPSNVQVVITWDGDPRKTDNFTAAIPKLHIALPDACFVAFKLSPKSGRAAKCPAGFRDSLPRMRSMGYEQEPTFGAGTFVGISVPSSAAATFADLGIAALRWLRARAPTSDILVVRTGAGGSRSSSEPSVVAACPALAGAAIHYEDVCL